MMQRAPSKVHNASAIEKSSAFYNELCEEERAELCKAIAKDIYFLEESLQREVLEVLYEAEPKLAEEIRKINSFTI